MSLLQLLGEQLTGVLWTVAILVFPGIVATVLSTPFLASTRVRSMFGSLPPTQSLVLSFALIGISASLPFVVGLGAIITTINPDGAGPAPWSNAISTLGGLLFVAYTIGAPIVGAVALPRLGYDWDSTDYGPSTWLLLACFGAWYALLFAVPLVLLSIVFALPGGY